MQNLRDPNSRVPKLPALTTTTESNQLQSIESLPPSAKDPPPNAKYLSRPHLMLNVFPASEFHIFVCS